MIRRWRTILAWPDTHIPDHDRGAVESLIGFAGEFNPDSVLILGDFLDMKGPARWSRGTAEEYQTNLQADCDEGVSILDRLRTVYDGPISYIEGNHEDRIRRYLAQYAPALRDLRALRLPELLEMDRLEIDFESQPLRLAPGWVAIHGDKLSSYGGGSAMKMAKQFGASVVQGHTHRLAQITETRGFRTDRQDLAAVECGHLSSVERAGYIKFGSANWQTGFALINISSDGAVFPELVPVEPIFGDFMVHGIDFPLSSEDDD